MKTFSISLMIAAALLTGCKEKDAPQAEMRPVRWVKVEKRAEGDLATLTGQIKAQDQVSMAFRLDGRMTQRLVNVGDKVQAGQLLAQLDPQVQENQARSAAASVSAAQGQLQQARNVFDRQQQLLIKGYTTQEKFDQAQQAQQTAQAQLDSAQAQAKTAQEQLAFTKLTADFDGTVTAVGAEQGEVVRAGQSVVQLARYTGRDAVFEVPPQMLRTSKTPAVTVTLTDDPKITAQGQVREVAPQADPITRTYQVKVGIDNPPPEMLLGATVTGTIRLDAPEGVEIPASAVTEADGKPALWVVDPAAFTVALRPVEIVRHDPASVIVSRGVETGEIVVTAGVQALHPGQKVRLMEAAP